MADPPVQKISISGTTLAMIMQRFATSHADCDGLLFGHVQTILSPNLHDDDQIGVREDLVATITGHCCAGFLQSFYNAAGRVDQNKLNKIIGERDIRNQDPLIGWFIGRRNTPLRPSMRETAVTSHLRTSNTAQFAAPNHPSGPASNAGISGSSSRLSDAGLQRNASARVSKAGLGLPYSESSSDSLSSRSPSREKNVAKDKAQHSTVSKVCGIPASSPCIFLIFSESFTNQSIHTHEYRAFQYHKSQTAGFFEARTADIVNIGPAFRSQYNAFAPVSPFPLLSSDFESLGEDSADSRGSIEERNRSKARQGSVKSGGGVAKEQVVLDMHSSGYSVDRLGRLMGPDAMHRVSELEDLYGRMITKLEYLAKQVGESSEALVEQEKHNIKLRSTFAGID
eukprot:Gb_27001 [translate_table: standard]